jgi:hypothetical protein
MKSHFDNSTFSRFDMICYKNYSKNMSQALLTNNVLLDTFGFKRFTMLLILFLHILQYYYVSKMTASVQ